MLLSDSTANKTEGPLVVSGSFTEDFALKLLMDAGGDLRQEVRLRKLPLRILNRIVGASASTIDPAIPLPTTKGKVDLAKAGQRLLEMTDPYQGSTRKKFTEAVHQDPILSQGLERRQGAFMKYGYTLALELKSKPFKKQADEQNKDGIPLPDKGQVEEGKKSTPDSTPAEMDGGRQVAMMQDKPANGNGNGKDLGPEQDQEMQAPEIPKSPEQIELEQHESKYGEHLQTLYDWSCKREIDCLNKMKTGLVAAVVQGRTLALMTPGITDLAPGKLPVSLKIIHTEDIGAPIVDQATWLIVGVRLVNLQPKVVSLPTDHSYITRKDWGLWKESGFYGASAIEPVLIVSQAYRKGINYDAVKALIAAYLTKLMLSANVQGMGSADRLKYLEALRDSLTKHGTDIVVAESGVLFQPVPVTVDKDAIQFILEKYEELLMTAVGTTKSQMNKTEGLTRDNATIQEQVFIDYTREPDEELIKTAFENDIFTPLLAHLAGHEDPEEMPVKVIIVRNEKPNNGIKGEDKMAQPAGGMDGNGDGYGDPGMGGPNGPRSPFGRQRDLQAQKAQEIQRGQQDGNEPRRYGAAGPSDKEIELYERQVRAQEDIADHVKGRRKEERYVKPGQKD